MAELKVTKASDVIDLAVTKANPTQTVKVTELPQQPKIEVVNKPAPKTEITVIGPPVEKDVSSVYANLNGTIINKKTKTAFRTPQEFFNDSGFTSFSNLKFDTEYKPLTAGRLVDEKTVEVIPLNLSGPQVKSTAQAVQPGTRLTKLTEDVKATVGLGKAVVEGTARSGASVGLTISTLFGGPGGLSIDPNSSKFQQSVQKFLFGEEPVKDVSTRILDARDKIQKATGLGSGTSLGLSIPAIVGLTALDFTGLGGEGKLIKLLAKLDDEVEIAKVLRKVKVAEDIIPAVSKEFVLLKDEKAIKLALGKINELQKTTKKVVEDVATTKKLETEASNIIADEAITYAKKFPDSSLVAKEFRDPVTKELIGGPRLFKRIGEALRSGEINIEDLPKVIDKYKGVLTNEQAARLFEDAATYAGRTLQALSRVEKELRAIIPDIPIEVRPLTGWERFKNVYLSIDNFRRSLLVTQLATAARNAISQAGRYTLGTVTDALNGVIGTLTGQPAAFAPAFEDLSAIFRRMSSAERNKLQNVLNDFPLENARLFNTPVGDVALSNKISNFFNTLNRTQEYYFRNLILDSKLHAAATKLGTTIEKLPMEEIGKAVDDALEWTFSKSPGPGTAGRAIMNAYREIPPLTLINPFPRFMSNAVRFLYEYSPAGILSLFRPQTRAAIAAGDYNAISKAIIGTTMLGAAMTIRGNESLAGERWYEIKIGDKTFDARPFAPFSTYLFLAEMMMNGMQNISGKDIGLALIGINRISGTGLALVDLLSDNIDANNFQKIVEPIISSYISGFTVPFVTIKDIIGQFRLEERVVRDTADQQWWGKAIANVPGLNEILPERSSFFEDKPLQREDTILRQVSGVTLYTKAYIQEELDRLNKSVGDLLPKTGNATANRILIKQTGILLNDVNDLLEQSATYQNASDDQKLEIITKLVSEAKKSAKAEQASALAAVVYQELKKAKASERVDVLEELKNRGLLTEPIQEHLLLMVKAEPLP